MSSESSTSPSTSKADAWPELSRKPASDSDKAAFATMPQDSSLLPPLLGALEHLRDAILLTDHAGHIVYHNAAFSERYGYEREPLNAAGGLTALFPDPAVSQHITAALADEETFSADIDLCTYDGHILPTHVTIQGVEAGHLSPTGGAFCTLVDLSNQHKTREQLRLQAQVIAQIREAVLAIDADGLITFFNRGAEDLYGVSAAEALGQPAETLLYNQSAPNGREPFLLHAFRAGVATQGEDTIRLSNGRTCEVSITVKPLWEGAAPSGMLAVLREVTEEKQQEARIRHRLHVEGALVESSRLLVSSGDVDFEQVLGVVGKAVGAQCVYLVTIPPDNQPLQEVTSHDTGMSLTVWHEEGQLGDDWWPVNIETRDPEAWLLEQRQRQEELATEQHEPPALAVPVLSRKDMLYGYLGFEYGGRSREELDEDIRVLNLLGDLLATYFEREFAEHALRESEERYRTFINTTTEAVWRIELEQPLPTNASLEEQTHHLHTYGILAECNQVMARLLNAESPSEVTGRPVRNVVPFAISSLFPDFAQEQYTLHSREYTIVPRDGDDASPRHFMVSAVGTLKNRHVIRIWGTCIEVTERVELERRMVAALEEQQQRIGRDLHDGVGQLLTGVRMLSSNLAERFFPEEADGYEQAHKVARFADEASQRVREIYRGLTPAQLYHEGLSAALEELAYNTNGLPGLSCSFKHDGTTDIWDREAKLHLYRIAQEATNNALKHANPKTICISLTAQDDQAVLQIQDDGKGFDPNARRGKSLGLDSLHYRARAIDATLTIDSERGSGTIIRCLFSPQDPA